MPEKAKDQQGDGRTEPHEDEDLKVTDRRHWASEESAVEEVEQAPTGGGDTIIDQYRKRTEEAEAKLQEYIDAFRTFKSDQESFRERLNRDIERKVELQFSSVVEELLVAVDDLGLALTHVESVPEAKPLAEGIELVRKRFLATLERQGVAAFSLDGQAFDPNEAEALRVDPVDSPERNGVVTETLRPGYRLGDHIVRPAQVAVGRHG